MNKKIAIICMMLIVALITAGCSDAIEMAEDNDKSAGLPDMPDDVEYDADGVPMIKVYVVEKEEIETMDIETYLKGVVAGEMRNDWPIEALKAQAILARTYTMKFLDTKNSKYDGADISTDITEAQAYNAGNINERVKRAVDETRGIIMTYDGELPMAWFHAHSGGMTELASIAIDYKEDPKYLKPVAALDSDKAPEDVKNWKAEFSIDEVINAAKASGADIESCETIELGKKGDSGRAATIVINGKEISAPTFRINIGADKLKSTLIDDIIFEDGRYIFTGKGYGHGVGMSQWGAFALAEKGATAQTIVSRYYSGVSFVDLWE